MKKFGKVMAIATVCTLWGSITAFAGEWKSNANGWWYIKDDGNYVVSDWLEDNMKMYYFNADGYMASNAWVGNYYLGADGAMLVNTTTPDGYQVGMDGAWIQNIGYLERYAEVLRELDKKSNSYVKYCFKLVYVDEDMIPELIIHSDYNRPNPELYTYYQGNAKKSAEDFGYRAREFFYVERGNLFYTTQWFNGGGINNGFYSIKDGECVSVKMFREYSDWSKEEIPQIYSINDQEVLKSTYDSQLNEMKNGYSFKKVNRDTTHEVNEANIQKMLSDINSAM